ncbi:hypothetical protein [Kribbella deserti]|uniref:Uncharacterized protein n=1 Tax=Kribbella deserti TaxID=1926257 RepID=A0ABV6QWE4_9ACTN
MGFTVSLTCAPTHHHPAATSASLVHDASYESLVIEACSVIADGDCRFHIGGFGKSDWGLDIEYDMSAFMEQLPDLIAGLRARRSVEVDLYSQGIERTLEFDATGDEDVRIFCRSRTAWVPDPSVEIIGSDELQQMLVETAASFGNALAATGSVLAHLHPFAAWRKHRL